jgi:hypothetical protein
MRNTGDETEMRDELAALAADVLAGVVPRQVVCGIRPMTRQCHLCGRPDDAATGYCTQCLGDACLQAECPDCDSDIYVIFRRGRRVRERRARRNLPTVAHCSSMTISDAAKRARQHADVCTYRL